MIQVINQGSRLSLGVENRSFWIILQPVVLDENGSKDKGGNWVRFSEDSFRSEGESFACYATFHRRTAEQVKCSFRAEFKKTLSISGAALPQILNVDALSYLNRRYQWKKAHSRDVVDGLTPGYLAGRDGKHTVSLQFRRHGLIVVNGASGKIDLYIDHAWTHPRIDHRDVSKPRRDTHLTSPARPLEVAALLTVYEETRRAMPGPVAWRYPDGRLACFVITDHADYDTTERMRALYLGKQSLNSTRIRTTKSVFHSTVGRQVPDKQLTHGLDVPAFCAIIDEIHEAGHEICPHSIEVRPKPSELKTHPLAGMSAVLQALDLFATRYQSGTWIDHGLSRHLAYNYSQLGWDSNRQWHLVDLLRKRGFTCIWSYFDQSQYPVSNINQLSPPDGAVKYLMAALAEAMRLNPWKTLNYSKHAMRMRAGNRGIQALRDLTGFAKVLSLGGLSVENRQHRLSKAVRKLPSSLLVVLYSLLRGGDNDPLHGPAFPTLYCEQALPIGQMEDQDMMLFTSILDGNIYRSWNRIDSLIRERGIHVAHTYFCCSMKYNEPAILERDGQCNIPVDFKDIMLKLDERIRANELWNPTMKDCANWFKAWVKIEVEKINGRTVKLNNPTDTSLSGFSLMFPPETQAVRAGEVELRRVREEPPIFALDLPARCAVELTWATDSS